MEHRLEKALSDNFLTILNDIPFPCQIIIDEGGNWDLNDFNKIWINKATLDLFSEDALGYYARKLSRSKINSLQAQWNQIRQTLQKGSNGFVGPFTSYVTKPDNSIIIHEYHILLIDEIEGGYRTFFRVTTDYSPRNTLKTYIQNESPTPLDNLSERELEIAKLVSKGIITKMIAHELSLSERTIENHRANIRRKLHLSRHMPLTKYLSTLIPK